MCRRKSFCKHHYNAICDSCQLFFSFFFLLILGKKVAFSGERPRSFCQKNHKILWSQKVSATTCSARRVFKMIKLRALTAETFTKKFARGGKFSPKNGRLSPIAALFPHCEGAFPLPPCVRGEACVMRSSTVCCARMPNLEIAIFSGDLRRRRFPLAPPRGGLPQARREGRPFRPCGAPSWRCPAVVTLPSRYRSTPPLKILQIFRGGKRHSFQGKHGGTCFRGG